ncbi:MAG: LysR family transcriptional regulator [Nitrospira sp.]|nr:LysR family transcriptional regulator [Nitrospira sp.]
MAGALHFTKAAGVAAGFPAGVVRRRSLEQKWECRCSIRGTRVQLTRAGSIFREHAWRPCGELELAQVTIAEEKGGSSGGTLTVGVVPNRERPSDSRNRRPLLDPGSAVSLWLDQLSVGHRGRTSRTGRGVAIWFVPVVSDHIESQPLFEEDFVLIASQAPVVGAAPVPVGLAQESLILLPNRSAPTLVGWFFRASRCPAHDYQMGPIFIEDSGDRSQEQPLHGLATLVSRVDA